MKQRLRYQLNFYLLTILLFGVAKVAFVLFNYGEHTLGISDVCQVVWHGLSLDLSTALYFVSLPFLLTIISVWVKVPHWIFKVYYALIAIAFALAFVADTSLYPFWGFKLDASCLQYLETPTEAMASVSAGYLLLRLFAIVAVATITFLAYNSLSLPQSHKTHKIAETLFYLLLIPFIIIGIRGGLDESTTNIGQVYYSQNQFLNHSAVNPVFSFLSSMEKTASYVPDYHFMDDE